MSDYHQSVLCREVVKCLTRDGTQGGLMVDATLGGGGHSEALLQSRPDVRVMGLDQDPEAIRVSLARLAKFQERFHAIRSNFRRMTEWFETASVDGVVMDLGVSSHQLETAGRGFSFQQDGPLDMRMNPDGRLTAAEIVNTWREEELVRIFGELGGERHSRRVAHMVVKTRKHHAVRTTGELADLVVRLVPRSKKGWRIHPATRVFQSLRLAVNDELEALSEGLDGAWWSLKCGGRLIVVSFHSLEDRIVKGRFRKWEREERSGKILNKKTIRPSEEEIQNNPRARSAKMRTIEKQTTRISES